MREIVHEVNISIDSTVLLIQIALNSFRYKYHEMKVLFYKAVSNRDYFINTSIGQKRSIWSKKDKKIWSKKQKHLKQKMF